MKNRKQNAKQDEIQIEPMGSKLSNLPVWLTITFVKYWAAAAAVFFIIIGGSDIGVTFTATEGDVAANVYEIFKIIILIALFSALFMNYVTKLFARMIYNRRNDAYRFVIYSRRGFSAFLFYLLYSLIMSIILCIIVIKLGQHGLIPDPFGTTGGAGIEPFSYALIYIAVDAVFLFIKNLGLNIYYRISYSKAMKNNKPIIVEA